MGSRSSRLWIGRLGGLLGAWAVLCLIAWWLGRRPRGEEFIATPPPAQKMVAGVELERPKPAAADGPEAVEASWRELQGLGEPPASGAIGQFVESGLISKIVESLSKSQKWELFQKIAADPGSLTTGSFATLIAVLSKTDPELAFEMCLELNRRGDFPYVPDMQSTFRALADRNPRAAFEQWQKIRTENLPVKWQDVRMLEEVFNYWQLRDLREAMAAATQLNDDEDRKHAARGLAHALNGLFHGQPETWEPDAIPLARQLLSGAEEDESYIWALNSTAGNLVATAASGEVMKRWFRDLDIAPENKAWMTKAVASGWAERVMTTANGDQSPAWDWLVNSLPTGERPAALAYAVEIWCNSEETNVIDMTYVQPTPPDLAACSEWLIAQGLGPDSQEAMAVLAKAWGQQYEPEAALAWARAIPDEAPRQAAEATVEAELKKRFPTGWESAQQPLPERTR